jgi:hypothetical protein
MKNIFYKDLFWWPGNASKHVFNYFRRCKISFIRTYSGGLEMHQNTFLTTPHVKKYLF